MECMVTCVPNLLPYRYWRVEIQSDLAVCAATDTHQLYMAARGKVRALSAVDRRLECT